MPLLDLNAMLGPEVQREAAMRGLLGTMLGIGQASAPSPVPNNIMGALTAGGAAGINAYDDAINSSLKRGLLGAQIAKVGQDVQNKQRQQQFIQAMQGGRIQDTPYWRAFGASIGLDMDKVYGGLGARPWNITTNNGVFENASGALSAMSDAKAAEALPQAGASALQSWLSFHPDVPYQGGGGTHPQGATAQDAQGGINQLLRGFRMGGGGNAELRGDAGVDRLTDTAIVTGSTPMTPLPAGAPERPTIELPKMQSRGVVSPSVPPATAYGVNEKPRESFGDEKGKVYGKAFGEMRESASKANAMEQTIAFMRSQKVEGGFFAPAATVLGSIAKSMGADDATIKRFTGIDVNDAQAYDAAGKELVFSMIGSLGTGVSNADRSFIEAIVPQLRTVPGAADKLFDYLQAKADWSKARWENAFDADMTTGGKDVHAPLKADREWKKKNSFSEWMRQYPSLVEPKAAPDAPVPTPKPIPGRRNDEQTEGALPEGLPLGTREIGTIGGKRVFLTRDGRRLMERE